MSYKTKPQLKLYKYNGTSFILQAIIDDYMEFSFEDNLYSAGAFTISINYNIPNALLFQRGLFVAFGDGKRFGEIINITDAIGSDGKGSQIRTITGYDARYIFKRRIIKNLNNVENWAMTAKGELCMRNLVADQCGTNAEVKRQLPVENNIPASADAIGKEYSVSESFSNLYEVLCTIATQSEIGWRLDFDGEKLKLVCFNGVDRHNSVRFDTNYESLSQGQFTDSSDSYANSVYVGGKGQGDDRDIYEGEALTDGNAPEGLDRFEAWDNQSGMTTSAEYEAEALSILSQYGQTLQVSGKGLAKSPYIYGEEYEVGDIITIAFSGKSAVVQILSVTEHWAFNSYDINFSFGKPQPDLNNQLQLILKQIQKASNKSNSTDSVRWYTIPTDTEMPSSDVTYNTIGFIGDCGAGATFKLYLDNEKTGSKTYHIYFKQLAGGKLTLTTGVAGATNLVLNSGTYVAIVYVDENGNISSQGMTATNTIQTGNNQPATSSGVAGAISDEVSARNTAITDAINALDVASVGGSGKYLSAISETNGKISATAGDISGTVTAGDNAPVSGGAVADILSNLPTDAVLHYSFDDLPDYPDGTADVRLLNNNTYQIQSTSYAFRNNSHATFSNVNGLLKIVTASSGLYDGVYLDSNYTLNKVIKLKLKVTSLTSGGWINIVNGVNPINNVQSITKVGTYEIALVNINNSQNHNIYIFTNSGSTSEVIVEQIYIGAGSYSTPIIDNASGKWNSVSQSGVAVKGVSGKGYKGFKNNQIEVGDFSLNNNFSVSIWVNPENNTNGLDGNIFVKYGQFILRNGASWGNYLMMYLYHDTSVAAARTISSDLLPPNQWTNIIIVKNELSLMAYINGVLTYDSELTDTIVAPGTGKYYVNTLNTTRPQSYDDLLIFDRALTEKEVLALYYNKANTPKYYSFADYRLDNM